MQTIERTDQKRIYKNLLQDMKQNLFSIQRELFAEPEEMKILSAYLSRWNQTVKIITQVYEKAEEQLQHETYIRKLKHQCKVRLLFECHETIRKITYFKCNKLRAKKRKRDLLTELYDRLLYIQKTY